MLGTMAMPSKDATTSRARHSMAPRARLPLKLADAVNTGCPWSGKPIQNDSLTLYRGEVVGFCNPGCRDKFESATRLFDTAIEKRGTKQGGRATRSRNTGARAT
jgi:hypothetical protein